MRFTLIALAIVAFGILLLTTMSAIAMDAEERAEFIAQQREQSSTGAIIGACMVTGACNLFDETIVPESSWDNIKELEPKEEETDKE